MTTTPVSSSSKGTKRRDLIIEATLDVIAAEGVSGASVRRVAAEADVPLGSMTYYFAGRQELLLEAFERFVERSVKHFHAEFDDVDSLESARAAMVRILTVNAYMEPPNIIIGAELYALAAHDPYFVPVQRSWMHRSRDAIRQYFDEATTLMLDAMVEGMSMHRSFERDFHPAELVAVVIERMTPPETYIGP
ncbi:MAG: TetR family transcriptional regulator [Actinomycetaceae bacterium]|nr:TetR family transcriptional regulator [Actinomycetaceae bacterium]